MLLPSSKFFEPQNAIAAKLSLKVCGMLMPCLCFALLNRILEGFCSSIGNFLQINVLHVSFRTLMFLFDVLIRADAPVMGTLWEFIMATDNEIG